MEQEQFLEHYIVGDSRRTLGRTISKADIVFHAGHSGDVLPHHRDSGFCRGQPFGQRIAPRTMTFAFENGLTATQMNPRAITYGCERLRFPTPVLAADTIRTTVTIGRKPDDPKRPEYGHRMEICKTINQHSKTVMYCQQSLRVERGPA